MAYYKRICDLREDHDLTQRQVAEYLKMPQPQYFRYEQGYRDIPTDILIALADLYKTSTDYILGRTDNSSPPPLLKNNPPDRPNSFSGGTIILDRLFSLDVCFFLLRCYMDITKLKETYL